LTYVFNTGENLQKKLGPARILFFYVTRKEKSGDDDFALDFASNRTPLLHIGTASDRNIGYISYTLGPRRQGSN
jgi:hypothetical protein